VAEGDAVPMMVRDCGEFAALSVIVRVVVRTPAARGEKMMEMAQEALTANEPLQVLAEMLKSDAL
jgi:hypothetical protein